MALAGAAIAGVAAIGVFAWALYVVVFRLPGWQRILENHFSAIIGLPSAAAVAFAIVVFLRQTEGPMEFEGLGFKIKGAAGQVFMWICCFLAIAGAIKLLW
ncbi:MAG: hypothetical protein K2X72_29835 [Reyranella sp.]|nr:hypothetical protein [Reyranella sp.]